MSLEQVYELRELYDVLSIESMAWKRVEPVWFVRLDDEAAEMRFVKALTDRGICHAQIDEREFWLTRSTAF
jgi:hypothetical protein